MNFSAFQEWREQCLRTDPSLLDCAETNLYRSLASLQPAMEDSDSNAPVHRCDIARAWLARYGFPESYSRQALICRGVRHGLALISKEIAQQGARLWAPSDVYPVYLELARAAGIEPQLFATLPEPKIPRNASNGQLEYLLIANPWKPLGRYLSDDEVVALANWLDASPKRHLLIDCVYDLDTPFHVTTRTLQETGKAILLHSITKGWLLPRTFGVVLTDDSHTQFESAFRNDSPTQEQLRLGRHCLSTDANCPAQVSAALQVRSEKFFGALPDAVRASALTGASGLAQGCYLFPVGIPAGELLRRHRLLGIPSTAFGANWSGSVLTSLGPAFAPAKNGNA